MRWNTLNKLNMHYTYLITAWLHYMNQQYFSLVPLREQSTDLYSQWMDQMTCASFSQLLSTQCCHSARLCGFSHSASVPKNRWLGQNCRYGKATWAEWAWGTMEAVACPRMLGSCSHRPAPIGEEECLALRSNAATCTKAYQVTMSYICCGTDHGFPHS
jgi:hypothetical protein